MRLRGLALVLLGGCGLATGSFNGGPAKGFGYGLGTLPGYGHVTAFHQRTQQTVSTTDVNLSVYLEFLIRTRSMNVSILQEFLLDSIPEEHAGATSELEYKAYVPSLTWSITRKHLRFWFGPGVHIGGVALTDARGVRGVAGVQTPFYAAGPVTFLLRLQGALAAGTNDFSSETINAGIVIWLDPDRDR